MYFKVFGIEKKLDSEINKDELKIGTSQRTIENHLAKLRKNEIIKHIGSAKTGNYEICNLK